MAAPIIRQGDRDEVGTWPGPGTVIEHVQGPTSNSWVQAYRYAAEKAAGGPSGWARTSTASPGSRCPGSVRTRRRWPVAGPRRAE